MSAWARACLSSSAGGAELSVTRLKRRLLPKKRRFCIRARPESPEATDARDPNKHNIGKGLPAMPLGAMRREGA
eukprot:9351587-Alexandrium_andersonii.AAC.1